MNPDSFEPNKGKRVRASSAKRVAMFVFGGAGILLLLVTFAILQSGSRVRSSEPKKLFEPAQGDAAGLESLARVERFVPEEEVPEPEPLPEIAIPVPQPVRVKKRPIPRVSTRSREKHSARLLAANARTTLDSFSGRGDLDNGGNAAPVQMPPVEGGMLPAGGGVNPNDPNGWDAKDSFLRRQSAITPGYAAHMRTPQISPYELKSGTRIHCVLDTPIHSDLPGNSVGVITENIYDTATGLHLLIPQGAKVVGEYDNRITYGQSRMLIIWSKIVFPDGSTLMLDNLSAMDQRGRTGIGGRVNRHWNSVISAALLVSLLGSGVDVLIDDDDEDNDRNSNKARDTLARNAARSVAEAMSQIISREASRAPTITIKAGTRFSLFVRQDMIFAEPYM